jgi:hypothetical protein
MIGSRDLRLRARSAAASGRWAKLDTVSLLSLLFLLFLIKKQHKLTPFIFIKHIV